MYEELLVSIDRSVKEKKWIVRITCFILIICIIIITIIISITEITKMYVFSYHMENLIKNTEAEIPTREGCP